jgi:adenylate cyclase
MTNQPLFSIRVFEQTHPQKLLLETSTDRAFRIGRQEEGEPATVQFVEIATDGSSLNRKLIIATVEERQYSRRYAEIYFAENKAEIRNTNPNQILQLDGGAIIGPNENRIVGVPFGVTIGERRLAVDYQDTDLPEGEFRSLPDSSPFRLHTIDLSARLCGMSLMGVEVTDSKLSTRRTVELLEIVLAILQNSPDSQDYFDNAAQALAELLELDHLLIAFNVANKPPFGANKWSNENWTAQAFVNKSPTGTLWNPSAQIIDTICRDKKTIYQIPSIRSASLMQVKSLVASPLRNLANEVTGFIYGDREKSLHNQIGFNEVDAKFVETFANGISVGLHRMAQEKQISRMRATLDQFFTASLARHLEENPDLLKPKSAEVSVLFADIRGFSRIAERIGPEKTIYWINSMMNRLSDAVFKYQGVVVDYVGDEILAMWGAPLEQTDHAELAIRAALEMVRQLPEINNQWAATLGEEVDLGIGINSGEAQVGNTGAERKFKYGPLGDVVNVASRLQGATKQLRARLLVTESTARAVAIDIPRRRVRSVRFVNVQRAISVFEVPYQPDSAWQELKREYETGLRYYESGEFGLACQQMSGVINRFRDDGPSLMLLADSVRWLQSETPSNFDPVWQLLQK